MGVWVIFSTTEQCSNLLSISYVGRSTLVGRRPMKSLLSVCESVSPSVSPSARPSQSFPKIGSLVTSDIVHDDS